jgi:putative exporter of polyketide antibiotics
MMERMCYSHPGSVTTNAKLMERTSRAARGSLCHVIVLPTTLTGISFGLVPRFLHLQWSLLASMTGGLLRTASVIAAKREILICIFLRPKSG